MASATTTMERPRTAGATAGPAGDPDRFGDLHPGPLGRFLWGTADSRALSTASRARLRKVAAAVAPGPFDIEAEGLNLRVYPADNHSDRVAFVRGRLPDRDERDAIEPFLEEGGTFVDVGANVGVYSLWAARRLGPAGTVVAVEPHPVTADKLAFNAAANALSNVSIVRAAAGETDDEAELHESGGGNVGQSSLLRDVAFRPDDAIRVPMRPLDRILADEDVESVDVMKIDVEGYEDRALMPFLREAPDSLLPRAVVLETDVSDRWETDCLAALAARGYAPHAETVANAVLTRPRPRVLKAADRKAEQPHRS